MTASATAQLKSLLGPGFAVATARPTLLDDTPFPEERRHIEHACAERRAEFATVRACARRALGELGRAAHPFIPSADGSPRWPEGVVGSMSHSDTLCAAAVAEASRALAVGVDLEADVALDGGLEAVICTASERSWIGARPPELRGALGKLVFGAKEAFYKCQHPLTGAFLDFADVDIAVDPRSRTFRVTRVAGRAASALRLEEVRGGYGYAAGHLITTAVIARRG